MLFLREFAKALPVCRGLVSMGCHDIEQILGWLVIWELGKTLAKKRLTLKTAGGA